MNECKEVQGPQPLEAGTGFENRLAAWLVHFYTASGVLAAFFGTLAVVGYRYRDAFLFIAVFALMALRPGGLLHAVGLEERV